MINFNGQQKVLMKALVVMLDLAHQVLGSVLQLILESKYEAQVNVIQELSSISISLVDGLGLLKIDKVKPKKTEAQ